MKKSLKSLLLLLFFPLIGFAQSLNGVYTGVLSNDSTTIRRDQSFEMALTEYNGKVYGYAYSTFIVNDTLYYIVKRVKGKVMGDICEVEDDEVITHNFPKKPEKKVFVSYTLRRSASDSLWRLDGNWKTNLTKKYYAISGKVETKEEKDLSKSKLYEHLGDLDLQKTLAFEKPKEKTPEKKPVKPKEENAVAKNTVKKEVKENVQPSETKAKPDTKVSENKTVSAVVTDPKDEKKNAIATNTSKPDTKVVDTKTVSPPVNIPASNQTVSTTINNQPAPNEKKNGVFGNPEPANKKPETAVVVSETKVPDNKPVVNASNNQPNQNEKKSVASTNQTSTKVPPATVPAETKTQEKKLVSVPVGNQPSQYEKKDVAITEQKAPEKKLVSVPVGSQPVQAEKKDVVAAQQKATDKASNTDVEFQELKRTNRRLKPAASLVDGRVSVPSETIYFKSDSLSIALYDNGEVDGDTVSVIINDEMFIAKQGLKSSAFRKTFYVPNNESDSLLVVLFAENLGKYPPNTGLLQIKDGEEIFYVRFKADLDRNAAIVLRRKYK